MKTTLKETYNTKQIEIVQYDKINRIGVITEDRKIIAFCKAKRHMNDFNIPMTEPWLKGLFLDFDFSLYEDKDYNTTYVITKVNDLLLTLIKQGYNVKLSFKNI